MPETAAIALSVLMRRFRQSRVEGSERQQAGAWEGRKCHPIPLCMVSSTFPRKEVALCRPGALAQGQPGSGLLPQSPGPYNRLPA